MPERPGEPPSPATHQLTDITRGIHHAAASTMRLVASHYLRLLDQFFERAEDGTLVAKMVRIAVDEQHEMYVPLVTLAVPRGMYLDKMRVEMTVQVADVTVKKPESEVEGSDATRSSFKVAFRPRAREGERGGSEVDIIMEFASMDPPEGLMRLIEPYTNAILPQPVENPERHHRDHPNLVPLGRPIRRDGAPPQGPRRRGGSGGGRGAGAAGSGAGGGS